MISIVKTHSYHLPQLALMGKEQWPREKWITSRFLLQTMMKKGVHVTAIIDGKTAGCIMVVEEDFPKFWIHYFIVDKKYRRQGIGSDLLQKVESKIPRHSTLFVDLEKKDHTGYSFYRKNGFKLMGTVKKWFISKEAIILAKQL